MVAKAVCVLKGTGEVTGTVFFEQQVEFYHNIFCSLVFGVLAPMLKHLINTLGAPKAFICH